MSPRRKLHLRKWVHSNIYETMCHVFVVPDFKSGEELAEKGRGGAINLETRMAPFQWSTRMDGKAQITAGMRERS
jgi:hypothetical protein